MMNCMLRHCTAAAKVSLKHTTAVWAYLESEEGRRELRATVEKDKACFRDVEPENDDSLHLLK